MWFPFNAFDQRSRCSLLPPLRARLLSLTGSVTAVLLLLWVCLFPPPARAHDVPLANSTQQPLTVASVGTPFVGRIQRQLFPGETYTALLIVGNNLPLSTPQRNLQYAEADALRMAQQLKRLLPEAPLELLLSRERPETKQQLEALGWWAEPATLQALEVAVERLARFIAEARQKYPGCVVQVLVYFASYGEPDGSLHLDDALTPSLKQRLFQQLKADQVLELADTGQAATGARAEGSAFSRSAHAPEPPPPALEGAAFLAMSENFDTLEALRGGVLTRVLLSGLYGLADLDEDGLISWEELVTFVEEQLAERPPAPVLQSRLGPEPDLALVSLSTLGRTGIRLDKGVPSGLVLLYRVEPERPTPRAGSPPRTLLTQFYHQRGRPAELRLPVGRYQLVRLLEPRELAQAGSSLTAERLLEAKVYPATSFEFTLTEKSRHHITREKLTPLLLTQPARRGEGWGPFQWPHLLISAEQAELIRRLRSRYDRRQTGPLPQQTLTLSVDVPGTVLKLGEPGTPTPLGMGLQLGWTFPLWRRGELTLEGGPGGGYGRSWQPGVFTGGTPGEPLSTLWLHRLSFGGITRQTVKKGRLSLGSLQRLSWSPAWATQGGGLAAFDQSGCQSSDGQLCDRRFLFLADVTAELSWYAIVRLLPGVELGPVLRLEGLFLNPARMGVPLVTWSVGLEVHRFRLTP